jgi:septum site-determining protein MinC
MKLRGALGGLNLLIEASDTPLSVREGLAARQAMLGQKVTTELAADADPEALEAVFAAVRAAGGELGRVRGIREQLPRPAPEPAVAAPGLESASGAASAPALPAVSGTPGIGTQTDSARTEILQHGLRAGFRGEYRGSVVVLGDVNPGAELIAAGDVIVMGALRGVVHAGAGGRTDAIVYARPISSAQIRIAGAVARSADDNSLEAMRRTQERPEAELARLQDGVIQIESYQPQRS